jgi:hypothetical protein
MILERQAAIARATPETRGELRVEEPDPPNANEALQILGIGGDHPSWGDGRLGLLSWAVQAALDRYRGPPLQQSDLTLVRNSTIDPDQVRWPPDPEP